MELKPNTKLTPRDFVKMLYPYALESEKESKISAIAILAQAAVESFWNKCSPGWMLFGVKDTDGVNGNEQLLTTTEYSRRQDLKFPVILKVEPVVKNGIKYFKYTVKDYFRKYNSPKECFDDHANFFYRNPRYGKAILVSHDPYRFIEEIARAGYATDPKYADTLKSVARTIERLLPTL